MASNDINEFLNQKGLGFLGTGTGHAVGLNELLGIGMLRAVHDCFGGSVFHDASSIDHGDLCGDMLDNVQVVADEEHRKAAFLQQTVQGEEDLHLYRRIEGGDNFVTDEQIGMRKDSARDAYTLASRMRSSACDSRFMSSSGSRRAASTVSLGFKAPKGFWKTIWQRFLSASAILRVRLISSSKSDTLP